jgi:hypothetical protein
VTSTPKRTPPFRKMNFSGRKTTENTSKKGAATEGSSSRSNSQVYTPRGGISSTQFNMAGHDPMIRLPEFRGEASEDSEKHIFICENIWKEKHMKDQDTKLA